MSIDPDLMLTHLSHTAPQAYTFKIVTVYK